MIPIISLGAEEPVDIKASQNTNRDDSYTLLAPIPGLEKINDSAGIGGYLEKIFLIGIGLAGVLAVVMIVINGIVYMGDESVFGKTKAKERILMAIGGLVLALGAWVVLNTINPDLVGSTLSIKSVDIEIVGDTNAPISVDKPNASSIGIVCNGGGKANIPTIAKSFSGKMTYSQDIPKGQPGPNNTIKLDCSGYVNYVLSCAGVDNSKINSGTSIIFTGAEKVNTLEGTKVNGKEIQIGDLVGWKPSDDKKGYGHVMIYIGGGLVADSHGSSAVGKAFGSFSLSKYKDRITYIRRM